MNEPPASHRAPRPRSAARAAAAGARAVSPQSPNARGWRERFGCGSEIPSATGRATVGKRRANRLLNERAQAADEEIGDAGVGRRRGGVERFEVRQQRELDSRRASSAASGVVGIDRRLDGAREGITGQARQRVAADHVDLRLGLVLEEGLIDLVLRALDVEGLKLWPACKRQRQGLIERV